MCNRCVFRPFTRLATLTSMIEMADTRRGQMGVAGLSLALLMTALDASLANTSLPALARGLDASFAQAQWIVLAYLLAVTSLTVVAGRAGDVLGRRRVFLTGLTIFTVASAVCAAVPSLRWLIAARAAQGAGAAAMLALPFALVGEIARVRPERAMGQLTAMSAVGTTLGPAVGGVLSQVAPGAIFLVNLPLGCAAFVLALRYVPRDGAPAPGRVPFDPIGIALLTATLLAYAGSMTRGAGVTTWFLPGAALAGAAMFVWMESRVEAPLVPMDLLLTPAVSVSLAANAVVTTVVTSTLIVGPFYVLRALGVGQAAAGLLLSTGPAVAAMAASGAGHLIERVGTRRGSLAGLAVMTAGGALFSLLPTGTGAVGYVGPLAILTAGYATFQTANNSAALTGAGARRGVVAGLLTLSRNIGQITGASAMGALFLHHAGGDITTAAPVAIADGMHGTFAVATLLTGIALVLVARTRAAAISPNHHQSVHP